MTVSAVLRHDFTVLRRTIVGRFLLAIALGATVGGPLVGYILSNGPVTSESLGLSLWLVVGTVLPFGVLLTAAVAIVADRETGRLRLLFGAPITKADLFVGVFLSRSIAISLLIAVSFTIIQLLSFTSIITVSWRTLWPLAGSTFLLCVAYTAIGTAISAVATTRLRAVGVAIAFYIWAAFWPQLVSEIAEPNGPQLGEPTTTETISHFIGTLSPFGAYSQIVTPSHAIYGAPVSGPLLTTPVMVLVLLLWTIVLFSVGYYWFPRADI